MSGLFPTISSLARQLSEGRVSSRELVEHAIARTEQINPTLNTVICLDKEGALAAAGRADQARADGETSPLLGVPMLHKDIFCTQGVRTSCASKMLADFIPPYNATVVDKLQRCRHDQSGQMQHG
jgi:aspartyl-tRNA(Asn)/glutamyl-tRNA(Gln) amidotransferase subunit A